METLTASPSHSIDRLSGPSRQMRPSLLAALASKTAQLVIVDQAYKGLSTPIALVLARRLLGQILDDISSRMADVTVIDIERILVRTRIDP